MIIRRTPASLLLITQPDHARQSAEIMRHWKADRFPESPGRSVILLAIAEHDNGWREVDAAPFVDDGGRVLDFVSAPAAVRRGIWPRAVDRLASTPYAAALVAQHALNVYGQYRANPEWRSFFSQMEATRNQQLLAAAPATLQDLLRDYLFVRIGDLISLTFCAGWREPQSDEAGYTIRFDGSRVTIAPDPFGGAAVPIEIQARELPAAPFPSAAAALEAFSRAKRVSITAVASGT